MHRHIAFLSLVALAALGCGPPWTVVQQSGPPSALAGISQASVEFDFAPLILDGQPAAQVLGSVPADERADLENLFGQMQANFVQEMAGRAPIGIMGAQGPPGAGEVRLTVQYTHIERGPRGPIGFTATQLTARLVWSIGGQVSDVIELSAASKASITRPSIAQRINICNAQIARLAAEFISREQRR